MNMPQHILVYVPLPFVGGGGRGAEKANSGTSQKIRGEVEGGVGWVEKKERKSHAGPQIIIFLDGILNQPDFCRKQRNPGLAFCMIKLL
jgi:hypothetical protein